MKDQGVSWVVEDKENIWSEWRTWKIPYLVSIADKGNIWSEWRTWKIPYLVSIADKGNAFHAHKIRKIFGVVADKEMFG
jgi:hypothetical protein